MQIAAVHAIPQMLSDHPQVPPALLPAWQPLLPPAWCRGSLSQRASPELYLQVKLVVLDSITFHFRQDVQDMGQRARMLATMAQSLMQAAETHELAVNPGTCPAAGPPLPSRADVMARVGLQMLRLGS